MNRLSRLHGVVALTLLATIVVADAQQNKPDFRLACWNAAAVQASASSSSSVTDLGCVLRAAGRPDQPYVATIRKVGLDLGITQESALAWGVYAPTAQLGPGDLSGNYAGAHGSASVGVGLGANVLIGGSANSIALQPLSVQGQTGLNVAVGLAGLELRPGR